mmetsp:Transcript_12160/g.19764  ORF Transcript_12160/g.19764 Transcript_12160/m.19764 type:complete len:461 (+) Transcript_12160:303-1685(+)|eukprot:CAMPEP_0203779440 /NCGR_PEP_ID=MMETSP0099_2-20121227/8697_1 /ASSEMBLY_ACC=CAM_ASM_000209 /TAXON_ID=96639 /ORGANISM=" , Strain NY0313808BC1" /LENGTH=460 /DNA_ID=CAMNT_0050679347 /DNA_START=441 /DNA_END=1823 /DNA_ORIENTATION=+
MQRKALIWYALLAVSLVDAADLSLLTALFKTLESEWQLSPTHLGYLSFAQSIAIKFGVILWGSRIDQDKDPVKYLKLSLIGIAIFSMLSGLATNFYEMVFYRFCNGMFVSILKPLTGFVISNAYSVEERGKAFGICSVFQTFGKIGGTFLGARFSTQWRQLLFIFGLTFSIAVAVVPYVVSNFPCVIKAEQTYGRVPAQDNDTVDVKSPVENSGFEIEKTKTSRLAIFKLRSFQLILLHGVFGSFPYSGFSFILLWFQTAGIANSTAALYGNALYIGTLFGHILAGYIGDYASKYNINHGRICVAQIADVFRLPVVFGIFYWTDIEHIHVAAIGLFIMGLVIPWVANGAIRPMLTELAPPDQIGAITGYHLALENIFSVMAAPLVGIIAEHVYHYDIRNIPKCPPTSETCFSLENHNALGGALLLNTLVPWTICALIVSALHWYFPKDRVSTHVMSPRNV